MRGVLMTVLIGWSTFLAFGYSLTYFGAAMGTYSLYTMVPELNTATTTGSVKRHNSLIQGTVNGCNNIGGILGCVAVMYLGNKLGRRKTTFIGSVIAVAGTVIFCTSFSMAQLVVSRIIQGFGLGLMMATVPVWQAELSTTKNRSKHVIIDGCMVSGGFALASLITYGTWKANTRESWGWRVPGFPIGFFSLIVACTTYMFPESPRWLVMVGRIDEARVIFQDMYSESADSAIVSNTLAAVVHANELASQTKWTGMFKMGKDKMLWRVFIAVSVQFYTQMNGAGIITSYSNSLFSTIGLTSDVAHIVAVVCLIFKFVMCFIAFFTVEKFGRRMLFMVSGGGMAVCMFALAICGAFTRPDRLGPAYAAIFFVFLFVVFVPLAYLGVNFLYCQEVISTRYRAPVGGISSAVLWLTQFVLALTTPLGLQVLSWKYYLVWGVISATIVPFVFFLYPETTDLSMEELDHIWTVGGVTDAVREARRLRAAKRDTGTIEYADTPGEEFSRQTSAEKTAGLAHVEKV